MRHHVNAALVLAIGLALGAPAQAQEPPPPGVKNSPGSGFTLFDGENFTAQVGGRIQARYTWEDLDEDRNKTDIGKFTAERVRLALKGTMYKDWKYEFQADFGKGQVSLRDASLAWAKHHEANITAGQFKVRFDRQQYVSSGRQQFVDRSLASAQLGLSRDTGVMVSGDGWDKKFQYNVGLFDGERGNASNANDGHLSVLRFSFNPNGDFGLTESDPKKTDYHLWYVEAAGAWNNDIWRDAVPSGSTTGDGKEQAAELTDDNRYVFGFGYKHAGFIIQGEYFTRSLEKGDGTSDVDADAWYAQAGYTFLRDKWEVAVRYSEFDPDDDKLHDVRTETQLGVNRFFKNAAHSLKLQGDITWVDEEKDAATSYDDLLVRLQAQIVF